MQAVTSSGSIVVDRCHPSGGAVVLPVPLIVPGRP